jgi:small-conductance mechanosensitive channel
MPRAKKPQTEVTTAEEGMTMILDTPVEKSIDEAAKVVGVAEIRLLEMFSERLELPEALGWETVPSEHESLLAEFKQQQDAFNSVRALEPEPVAEDAQEPPNPTPEPPVIEEESQPKKRSKAKSGAITKTRKSSLEKGAKSSQKATDLEQLATATLAAQKGTRKGANLAAIELTAQEGAYQHVKKEGLKRQIAKLASELEDEKNFDPQEMLAALGIPGLEETETELNDLIEGTLGKLGNASQEILDNAWMNGFDVETELENLQALLNLND